MPDYIKYPEMEMPEQVIGRYSYVGLLEIPAIGVSKRVMSDWSYQKLNVALCRYSGTAYMDNFVIMGHNNFDDHFAKLRQLQPGDEVIFTDMDGNVFRYVVRCMENLATDDATGMITSGYALSLFTCTQYSVSRLTVRCDRAN